MKTRVLALDPDVEFQTIDVPRGLNNLGYGRYNAGDATIDVFGLDPDFPIEHDADGEPLPAIVPKSFYVLGSDVTLPEGVGAYWGSARLADGTYRHVWA